MRCTRTPAFGITGLVPWMAIAALTVTGSASAEVLASPHLISVQQAVPVPVLTLSALGAGSGIFDMHTVQEDPVMRARRDYSLMAALPVTTLSPSRVTLRDLVEPQRFKLGRDIMLTFPLGLTCKSFVTAEFLGKGKLALDSTGLHAGGVFTFKGEF